MLTLAATARARGRRAARDRWYALCPQMIAAAEQVLLVLEGGVAPELLTVAVQKAMTDEPVTAVPKWALPLTEHPESIALLGKDIDQRLIRAALPSETPSLDEHSIGLAALAVAFCRSQDSLRALAGHLPEGDARTVLRRARLAQATVSAGEPSKTRGELKRRMRELRWDES